MDWSIDEKEKKEYQVIFGALKPVDNKIDGQTSKGYLINTKLPKMVLASIWNLSDVDEDGFLTFEEFNYVMKLIQYYKINLTLPKSLPSELIESARRTCHKTPSHKNTQIFFEDSIKNLTLDKKEETPNYTDSRNSNLKVNETFRSDDYKSYFDQLKTPGINKITGQQAAVIFNKTGISKKDLAQIWNKSDVDCDGCLNFEEFCCAMELIDKHLHPNHFNPTSNDPIIFIKKEYKIDSSQGKSRHVPPEHSTTENIAKQHSNDITSKLNNSRDQAESDLQKNRNLLSSLKATETNFKNNILNTKSQIENIESLTKQSKKTVDERTSAMSQIRTPNKPTELQKTLITQPTSSDSLFETKITTKPKGSPYESSLFFDDEIESIRNQSSVKLKNTNFFETELPNQSKFESLSKKADINFQFNDKKMPQSNIDSFSQQSQPLDILEVYDAIDKKTDAKPKAPFDPTDKLSEFDPRSSSKMFETNESFFANDSSNYSKLPDSTKPIRSRDSTVAPSSLQKGSKEISQPEKVQAKPGIYESSVFYEYPRPMKKDGFQLFSPIPEAHFSQKNPDHSPSITRQRSSITHGSFNSSLFSEQPPVNMSVKRPVKPQSMRKKPSDPNYDLPKNFNNKPVERYDKPLIAISVQSFSATDSAFSFEPGQILEIPFRSQFYFYSELNSIGSWFPFDCVKISSNDNIGFKAIYKVNNFRIAIYDAQVDEEDEIPFVEKDLLVEDEVNGEWIIGYSNGFKGIYPMNFTQTISSLKRIAILEVTKKHEPKNKHELELNLGIRVAILHMNSNFWCVGIIAGDSRIGFFPLSCVS